MRLGNLNSLGDTLQNIKERREKEAVMEDTSNASKEIYQAITQLPPDKQADQAAVMSLVSETMKKYPKASQPAVAKMTHDAAQLMFSSQNNKRAQQGFEDSQSDRQYALGVRREQDADKVKLNRLVSEKPYGADEYQLPFNKDEAVKSLSYDAKQKYDADNLNQRLMDLKIKKAGIPAYSSTTLYHPDGREVKANSPTMAESYSKQGFTPVKPADGDKEPKPGSYKYKMDKIKYVQTAVKNADELGAMEPEEKEKIKAASATEFDAYHGGWEKVSNPKTGERGYKKPNGEIVDIFGSPAKSSTPVPKPSPQPSPKPTVSPVIPKPAGTLTQPEQQNNSLLDMLRQSNTQSGYVQPPPEVVPFKLRKRPSN